MYAVGEAIRLILSDTSQDVEETTPFLSPSSSSSSSQPTTPAQDRQNEEIPTSNTHKQFFVRALKYTGAAMILLIISWLCFTYLPKYTDIAKKHFEFIASIFGALAGIGILVTCLREKCKYAFASIMEQSRTNILFYRLFAFVITPIFICILFLFEAKIKSKMLKLIKCRSLIRFENNQ